jgi:drug/metabolite transporter (DMT)-like permease
VLTAILWSLGGVLIKSIQWHPIAIAGLRSAFASLAIFAFLRKPKFIWTSTQWGSALAYVATVMLFVSATKMTSAANAILLQYTAPVYVALFSFWFLREKITRRDWITVAVVLCGMSLFFLDKLSSDHLMGNFLAIASGVAFAWLALFLRKQHGHSVMESLLLGNIITAIVALPVMLSVPTDGRSLATAAFMGVVQLGLPYILYGMAIKNVTALEAILIPVIEPILNPIWVIIVTGEAPSSMAILGGLIVIGAVTTRAALRPKAVKP